MSCGRLPIKLLSLLALLILSLLFYTYNPPGGFSLQPQIHLFTRWPRMQSLSQRIYDSIDKAILKLKLNVSSSAEQQQCSLFTKYSPLEQIRIDQDCQFCKAHDRKLISDVVYVHVLLQKKDEMEENLREFETDLRTHLGADIRIESQILDMSILPQHLKDKMGDELYINIIANEFASMRQSRHCRYTHKSCQSYTILSAKWDSLQEGYKQIGSIVFTKQSQIQQTIVSLLGGECLSASALRRVMKINKLLHVKGEVQKLQKMMDGQIVEPNIEFWTRQAQLIEKYAQGSQKQIASDMLNDADSVNIDLFPTEYKIGVYLPMALIMIIFPCFNLLKL